MSRECTVPHILTFCFVFDCPVSFYLFLIADLRLSYLFCFLFCSALLYSVYSSVSCSVVFDLRVLFMARVGATVDIKERLLNLDAIRFYLNVKPYTPAASSHYTILVIVGVLFDIPNGGVHDVREYDSLRYDS